ncbi:hypothetical protein [Clostridium sp. LCP25S3_F10]|uniref:hypothetical protein n=1 Tax=Clostridium sp. LCP25S3_F10 TaxID=3438750 RepID=UPI003F8E6837
MAILLNKFIIYGLVLNILGSIIGITLAHTLPALIVYNAYHNGFTVHLIELHFH